MVSSLNTIWVYLAGSPLLWLTATLLAYRVAGLIYDRSGHSPLANPVAVSVAILVLILLITGTPYAAYFHGAQFVHLLLGPATVALAIPLYQQLEKLKRDWFALLAGALLGGATASVSAMGIAWLLGASRVTILSIAPKSVTTPIAMGISEKIGGLPTLTAAIVMLTGILGVGIAQYLFRWMRIDDESTCGFAFGVAAHGVGTARAFQLSTQTGAFSGLAMGMCGLLTAVLLPLVLKLFGWF